MQSVNYSSHLERIDPDYPGFGMVVDESVATEKLHSLDHSLANPYRIVLSFKGIPERTTLESHYP